ncbi:hypothetical protein ACVJMZ_005328 [Sinorhizobium medicae]
MAEPVLYSLTTTFIEQSRASGAKAVAINREKEHAH